MTARYQEVPSIENSSNGYNNQGNDMSEFTEAVNSLKSQLEQEGRVSLTVLKEKVKQIENFAHLLENGNQNSNLNHERKRLVDITAQMSAATNPDTLLKITVTSLKETLLADRVVVYRFTGGTTGTIIAESLIRGWTPTLQETIDCTIFGVDEPIEYQQKRLITFHNTGKLTTQQRIGDNPNELITPYQKQLLDKYQIQSCLSVAILVDKKLWGLLVIQQCSNQKNWPAKDLYLAEEITAELGTQLEQFEFHDQMHQQAERQKGATKIVTRILDSIRNGTDINTIFNNTTQDFRLLLNVERVTVYKFRIDYFGDFVAESEAPGWPKLVGSAWEDPYLHEHKGGRFVNNELLVVDDVYRGGLTDCHVEALENFQIRACMVAPIMQGQKLWGLVSAFQNSGPRHWEEDETALLAQIGALFGACIELAESVIENQRQAEAEKAVSQIIEKIRKAQDLDTILRTTTQEVRYLLQADRVVVYRFNRDWSGQFIAESVGNRWTSLMDLQERNQKTQNFSEPKVKKYALWGEVDTFLQETEGSIFRLNEAIICTDIYKKGFSNCYIEQLELYEAKSYVMIPIFVEEKPWGLLATYQNSNIRIWEEKEVNWLIKLGEQLGIAAQQAEYLQKLENQSQQLSELAERERQAKELLQERALNLLNAVQPTFTGDLRIRAEVTLDEIGTIADAYNSTLLNFSRIVKQLQTAATQVGTTAASSTASISELTELAHHQLQEVNAALSQIQGMVRSTQAVAKNAGSVESAVQIANQTVQEGDEAMNRTVEGITAVRQTVASTGKKIKRLSESSQKISKVVSLISGFATQTQLLALNAAIEATRAGEYGRGFAVVADEVRSLARQSAAATSDIEKLVQEIQAEIREVAAGMATGIDQVVAGTQLVDETRLSLNAIASATAQISQLVAGITQATQAQIQESELVTTSMKKVANIANQTADDSQDISGSFQTLLRLSEELQESVGQFKVS